MKKEKRAKLLLAHHKDTFQIIQYNTKIRNRLFIYGLLILAFIIFDACSPNSLNELFNAYIEKSFSNQVKLNFNIIISASWFLLLCLVIEYYKRSIHVDRQFRYLGEVEENINTAMGGGFITREGKAYESRTGVPQKNEKGKRPFCLRAIGPLYTYVFPFALIGVIIWKACYSFSFNNGLALFDAGIGLVIVLYSVFYLWWILRGKKKS